MLFALNPLVEGIAWIACWFDLFATFFYLSTLVCLMIAWRERKLWVYLLSLIAFQLCLWSKESALTFPMVAAVGGLLLPNRPRLHILAAAIIPHIILLGINVLQRYQAWGSITNDYYVINVSTEHFSYIWSKFSDTLTLMAAPLNRLLFPQVVVQVTILVMFCLFVAGLLSGYNQRLFLMGAAWFVVFVFALFIASGMSPPVVDLAGGRLLYLPFAGFSVGAAALLNAIARRVFAAHHRLAAGAIAALAGIFLFVVLQVNTHPWVVAGRMSGQVTKDIHQFVPVCRPGTLLAIENVPHSYKGAFSYGIEFDLFNDYGQIFAWWPVPDQELSAVPYETIDSHYGGEMFYIRFATDSGGEQWNVAEAWGITRPGNSGPPSTPPYHRLPLNWLAQGILGSDAAVDKMLKSPPPERPFPPAGGIGWDFAQCHNDHGWSFQNLRARCKADQGLHISPRTADFSLTSPLLTLPAGWSEVIVTMDLRESAAEKAVIQVFWNTEESPGWREEQAYMLNLPTDTDKRSYHFFVFSETPINRLRLDPTNTMGDVVLRRVTVRPIP